MCLNPSSCKNEKLRAALNAFAKTVMLSPPQAGNGETIELPSARTILSLTTVDDLERPNADDDKEETEELSETKMARANVNGGHLKSPLPPVQGVSSPGARPLQQQHHHQMPDDQPMWRLGSGTKEIAVRSTVPSSIF